MLENTRAEETFGPSSEFSKDQHSSKYQGIGENFVTAITRAAHAMSDDEPHFRRLREAMGLQRVLHAGRIQAGMGSPRAVTPYNCFVSGTVEDSLDGIMEKAKEAALTMKQGGGIGYDFSTLRPKGDWIASQESSSSGPLSFAQIFNSVCQTISSAGNRRGAQMLVLRVDHPDIDEFIQAKQNTDNLTQFNISVGITDEFMRAVQKEEQFPLRFNGKVYRWVDAVALWNEIMRSTWDWAEPGVLFLDTANRMNNLWYCEDLAATNPCAEQWLPPYGACLLGSLNLVKYLYEDPLEGGYVFNWALFTQDVKDTYKSLDNVIDRARYPLEEQREEAHSKRRMGIGVTGLANCVEAMGMPYGSKEAVDWQWSMEEHLVNEAYRESALRAAEKGSFPLFDRALFMDSPFIKRLSQDVQDLIKKNGIRNSHLTSIQPTGTISLCADNVSSGIEPVFSYGTSRKVRREGGVVEEGLLDYGYSVLGVEGKTVAGGGVEVEDHLAVLSVAAHWNDSSVSKTVNVGDNVTFEQFKEVYFDAWQRGSKGCTTFRASGKRMSILTEASVSEEGNDSADEKSACYFDPETGNKTCDD